MSQSIKSAGLAGASPESSFHPFYPRLPAVASAEPRDPWSNCPLAQGRRPAFAEAPARLADDGSFWGKRLNDFFEARVAAERVPEGQQF